MFLDFRSLWEQQGNIFNVALVLAANTGILTDGLEDIFPTISLGANVGINWNNSADMPVNTSLPATSGFALTGSLLMNVAAILAATGTIATDVGNIAQAAILITVAASAGGLASDSTLGGTDDLWIYFHHF